MNAESYTSWEPLRCVDKRGNERTYYYSLEKETSANPQSWHIIVSADKKILDEYYDAKYEKIDERSVRSAVINNYGYEDYTGRGITEALIPEIAQVLKKNVVSSTNQGENNSQFRSEPAEKIWKKLVNNGSAEYDENTDTYTYEYLNVDKIGEELKDDNDLPS